MGRRTNYLKNKYKIMYRDHVLDARIRQELGKMIYNVDWFGVDSDRINRYTSRNKSKFTVSISCGTGVRFQGRFRGKTFNIDRFVEWCMHEIYRYRPDLLTEEM